MKALDHESTRVLPARQATKVAQAEFYTAGMKNDDRALVVSRSGPTGQSAVWWVRWPPFRETGYSAANCEAGKMNLMCAPTPLKLGTEATLCLPQATICVLILPPRKSLPKTEAKYRRCHRPRARNHMMYTHCRIFCRQANRPSKIAPHHFRMPVKQAGPRGQS